MATAAPRTNGGSPTLDHREWVDHTRVFLQPIAAPSILGLFGFAGATFMVAAHMAGWYGNANSATYLFPFAATFGGVAQFLAGMWAYRARDGVATAMHGTWGAFWIAFGVLHLLGATGTIVLPTGVFPELGYWFLVLAVVTGFGTIAALGENLGITAVLATLTVGSALAAVFFLVGGTGWETAAGWVLVASAFIAAYVAGAMMIAGAWGRTILPLGEYRKAANVPGKRPIQTLEYELGEPGVKHGQ
ncbi:MAG TPA: GPR1/FUN34/YaaH family transporter [Solirubrobacter sp.]|nr:GPR1/FUN34/YaaH family transporter [Solirubrobacter sp.]